MRGATPAAMVEEAAAAAAVPAPEGGWPSLSVVVLGTELSAQQSLAKLGAQDYPLDEVRDVLILGECKNQPFSGALASKTRSLGSAASLSDALAGCSGEVVALWGDDHVSFPDRLRRQVADVMVRGAASALKFDWFFSPAGSEFSRSRPGVDAAADFAALAEIEQNMSMSEGFLASALDIDPKTLCGPRALLADAASRAAKAFMMNSENSVKEMDDVLLLTMSKLPATPSIPQGVEWVAARPPPPGIDVEAKQEGPSHSLMDAARTAFPSPGGSTTSPLDELRAEPSVNAFVRSLLGMEMGQLGQVGTMQVRAAMQDHIEGCRGDDVADAVSTLAAWKGMQVNKGNRAAAKRAPYIIAAMGAFREHVRDNAENMHYSSLGPLAENLVKLCLRFFAADGIVLDEFIKVLSREPFQRQTKGFDEIEEGESGSRAYVQSLGFREPLERIGDAARFHAEDLPISGHASLAWAFSEVDLKDPGIADAMAVAAARDKDFVGPEEVGKLAIALGSRHWIRDAQAAGYVLQAMSARVQELKRADPHLATIIERSNPEH